jgi:tetratricopeptide (TPR) repeat protein
MSLNSLGILYGTDKSSLRHGYLPHYERLLSPFRETSFNLIEIGVYRGASLAVWHAYFPKATIVGVDIANVSRKYAKGRIKVAIGSQADPAFLSEVAAEYPPTVVIDDGSHRPEHQIFSFEHLFPLLRPGGCYIVEDLAMEVASLDGRPAISSVEYFAQLQLGLMASWQRVHKTEWPGWVIQDIDRIDAFGSAVAVWKSDELDRASDLWAIEDMVERSQDPESLLYFSEYLERKMGLFDQALEAAKRAAEAQPSNPWCQVRISSVLRSKGDIEGAIAAAQRAIELGRGQPYFGQFRDELLGTVGVA